VFVVTGGKVINEGTVVSDVKRSVYHLLKSSSLGTDSSNCGDLIVSGSLEIRHMHNMTGLLVYRRLNLNKHKLHKWQARRSPAG
jgi:hypothetical protein